MMDGDPALTNEYVDLSIQHAKKANKILAQGAKELWNSFTKMISTCGLMHAVNVALIEGAFLVGETAIGGAAAVALKKSCDIHIKSCSYIQRCS